MKVFAILVIVLLGLLLLTSNCEFILSLLGSDTCDTESKDYVFRNLSSYHLKVTYYDVECVLVEGEEGEDDEYTEEYTEITFSLHIGESRFVSAQVSAGDDVKIHTDQGINVKIQIVYGEEDEVDRVYFRDR